jgi:hypothetical protein
MPTPLIPDMAVFQRKLATLPLVTYRAGETVLSAGKTAKALGLDIPPKLLALADEVIE